MSLLLSFREVARKMNRSIESARREFLKASAALGVVGITGSQIHSSIAQSANTLTDLSATEVVGAMRKGEINA